MYERWNNPGQLQLTDMVQAMKMMNEMSPRQQQFDVPAMFTAMGSIMQAMKQDRQDPTAMIGVLQGIYDKMNAQTKEASQAMLEFYKSQIPPSKTLAEQLWELKEVQSSLGLRSEDPVIASKKLELQATHDKREHEWRREAAKEKRQSEMIKGITGAITRGLESPIIREAGRSVGQALSQR